MDLDTSLQRYLDDIRHSTPLRNWDEKALFLLYRKGSQIARQKLITSNMRFVVKVALEYRACPMPLPDLISEGSLGLIQAVESFDPSRGVKFISYAVWWIRSHITKALNERGFMIRLPSNQYFRLRKAQQLERHGKPAEEDLRLIKQLSLGCISLHADTGSNRSWSDFLADKKAVDPSLATEVAKDKKVTGHALSGLTENEQIVLKRTFGFETECQLNLKEVGQILGLSSERVRQIRKSALNKIRTSEHRSTLRDRYVGLLENQGR